MIAELHIYRTKKNLNALKKNESGKVFSTVL